MRNPIERFYFVYESKRQELTINLGIKTEFLSQTDIINQKILSIFKNRNICAQEIRITNNGKWKSHDAKNKKQILYIK